MTMVFVFFFFNDTAPTEIYTLSLHDALPISDRAWSRIEPVFPKKPRRFRSPGRKPLADRLVLQAILFVLHTGIGWEHLPQELGFGCGMTAWRRLRGWQQPGVWVRLHDPLLAWLPG